MKMRTTLARWLCLSLVCAACVEREPKSYGDPTALSIATESVGIVASVLSPVSRSESLKASAQIVISAYVKDAPAQLEAWVGRLDTNPDGEVIELGMQRAEASGVSGPDQRFVVDVPLLHGTNRIFARIATLDRSRVRTLSFLLEYGGAMPGLTLGVATPGQASTVDVCSGAEELKTPLTNRRVLCARGRISAVSGNLTGNQLTARLSREGAPGTLVPLDAAGRFVLPVELPQNQRSVLVLDVAEGAQSSSARFVIEQDETPPTLRMTSTVSETSDAQLTVAGSAADEHGIAALSLVSPSGGLIALPAGTSFEQAVPLAVGVNPLSVVAVDGAGNEARLDLSLTRVRVLRLYAPKKNVGTVDIEVDRQALSELIEPADQKTLELVAVDLEPAVRQALERIREPTRFNVDTSKWGAPEQNMQRILSMTPDVADVSGTSVAQLLTIASGVGIPAPRLLADLLDTSTTEYILDLDIAARVLVDQVVGSHPNIARDESGKPVLSVSMFDVLQNLTTVGPRFGPSGAHPGFLAAESRSDVLEPGFLLTFPVHSNLVQYDAVDLSQAAKAFLFLLEGERALDFNVLTDDFAAVGLVDEPAIDLRFLLNESSLAARAGNDRAAAPDAADPGFFRGNGQGFSIEPFLLEHVAAEIGYRQLHRSFASSDFKRVYRYDAGSIKDASVMSWDRGWVSITSAGGLGDPPPPLYAWDLLMETAEARLHDRGVAQGAASMAFALDDLPIGLTADELVEKLRPKLNEQQDELSKLLVGSGGLASSSADLFYVPAKDGDGALLFRDKSDGGGEVSYEKPGFFADPALLQKVSTTMAAFGSSDTLHEKVAAKVGAVYYAADERGARFEVRVKERNPDSIGLEVRRLEPAP